MAYWIELAYSNREPRFEFLDGPENMYMYGLSAYRTAPVERLPTQARETSKKKVYPDIFAMPGLNAVSERFKTLVESFEPGVHQFFPLTLYRKDGELVEDRYYIFNCPISFGCVLTNRSEVIWVEGTELYPPRPDLSPARKTVFSKPAIDGRHLWGESFRMTGLFISDELHKAMKREKIKYFTAEYCEELDEPWTPEDNIQPILDWEKAHSGN